MGGPGVWSDYTGDRGYGFRPPLKGLRRKPQEHFCAGHVGGVYLLPPVLRLFPFSGQTGGSAEQSPCLVVFVNVSAGQEGAEQEANLCLFAPRLSPGSGNFPVVLNRLELGPRKDTAAPGHGI